MNFGDEELVRLIGSARHAANNLAMVLLVNLESAAAGTAEGSREARQLSRALVAARAYDGLARALLGLWREERVVRIRAEDYLSEVLPLLSLAAARRLTLDVAEPGTVLEMRRPLLDLALLRFVAGAPPEGDAPFRLRGAVLEAGWRAGDDAAAMLAAAGVEVGPGGAGSALILPQQAVARS